MIGKASYIPGVQNIDYETSISSLWISTQEITTNKSIRMINEIHKQRGETPSKYAIKGNQEKLKETRIRL